MKDLAGSRLFNIGTGWTVKNYSFDNAKKVCHEHFEESCFETELQERLGFRIRKRLKHDAVPTIFSFKPTQSHGQQERKERAQKRTKTTVRSVTSSCWTWKTFLYLEGTIKCLTNGERKVHFTFVLDLFASARPPHLCIIYSIPPTSDSYYSSFSLSV